MRVVCLQRLHVCVCDCVSGARPVRVQPVRLCFRGQVTVTLLHVLSCELRADRANHAPLAMSASAADSSAASTAVEAFAEAAVQAAEEAAASTAPQVQEIRDIIEDNLKKLDDMIDQLEHSHKAFTARVKRARYALQMVFRDEDGGDGGNPAVGLPDPVSRCPSGALLS